jgi:hypothetical protein
MFHQQLEKDVPSLPEYASIDVPQAGGKRAGTTKVMRDRRSFLSGSAMATAALAAGWRPGWAERLDHALAVALPRRRLPKTRPSGTRCVSPSPWNLG